MRFSVIICSRDRAADLVRTLGSLQRALASATETWEIVVVDNASSDDTAGAARAALGEDATVVVEERLGLSHARNRGVDEARGEVLVFIDDDITVDQRWVRTYEETFEDRSVAAAGGPVETIFPEGSDADYVRAVMADGGSGTGHYMPEGGRAEVFPGRAPGYPRGGNMAIRAAAIEDVGEFDVALGWGKHQIPAEETELFSRMCAAGHRIWYVPEAHVLHRFQIEKVNWAYLKRWHRGYGRASVIMKGRTSAGRRLLRIIDQLVTWLRYSLIVALDRRRASAKPARKKWQAEGRLAQLLSLG